MTLAELIRELGGGLAAGSPDFSISGVNSAAHAGPSELVFAEDAASVEEALASSAGAIVVRAGLFGTVPDCGGKQVIEAHQPRLWFSRAARLVKAGIPAAGIHSSAVMGQRVELGAGVSIAANAVVGDSAKIGGGTRIEAGAVIGAGVCLGENCHIYPRVVLYPGTTLGNRVVVHAGAVLGADGFGYVRDSTTGAYTQFPQQGTLVIEDDVEIGANSTIDRGALAETRIRRGTKIDNLVHVGHNCDVGEDVILVMGTGDLGVEHGGQGRGDCRAGGHWGPCAHWAGRDSGRAGRGAERQDGDQRGAGCEAGNRAVGHTGAAAAAGAARDCDGWAIGQARRQRF